MTEEGVFFVTRLKRDLKYRVIQENPVPEQGNVRGDHWIELEAGSRWESARCCGW